MAGSPGLELTGVEARQLRLHVGQAARYAVADEAGLARTEALLAWAVLVGSSHGPDPSSLDGLPEIGELIPDSDGHARRACVEARESAYAFIGHFVSEQQPDAVRIYEDAVAVLDHVIEQLDGGGPSAGR
jgi:hypothetical protein